MIDSGDPSMKTEAPPEYNIAHYTPNANRRACHRDQHDDDAHGKDDMDSSQQCTGQELCVEGSSSKKDRQAWDSVLGVPLPV
jgi:hypothetical protein